MNIHSHLQYSPRNAADGQQVFKIDRNRLIAYPGSELARRSHGSVSVVAFGLSISDVYGKWIAGPKTPKNPEDLTSSHLFLSVPNYRPFSVHTRARRRLAVKDPSTSGSSEIDTIMTLSRGNFIHRQLADRARQYGGMWPIDVHFLRSRTLDLTSLTLLLAQYP